MARFNKTRLKVGDWTRIRFWDHRSNDDDVREYFASGRVHRLSQRAIILDSWALVDPESADRDPGETCENFCIFRKATVEVIKMIDENIFKEIQNKLNNAHKLRQKRDEEIAALKIKIQEGHDREIALRKELKTST